MVQFAELEHCTLALYKCQCWCPKCSPCSPYLSRCVL